MKRWLALALVVGLGVAAGCPAQSATPPPALGLGSITFTGPALAKAQAYLAADPQRTAVRITIEPNGKLGLSLDKPRDGDISVLDSHVVIVVPAVAASSLNGLVIDWGQNQAGAVGFAFSGTAAALNPKVALELREALPAFSASLGR